MELKSSVQMGILMGVAGMVLLLSPSSWSAESIEDKKETPVSHLDNVTEDMTKDMTDNQLLQFRAIEQSYRTIRAVEDVQSSVSKAMMACGKENPDLKEGLEKSLSDWKKTLRPTMKEARSKLDKMILLQDFTQPSSMRKYLKLFDAAVSYRNQGVEAIPVTEAEKCKDLEKSMTTTNQKLIRLLKENLALDKPLKQSDS